MKRMNSKLFWLLLVGVGMSALTLPATAASGKRTVRQKTVNKMPQKPALAEYSDLTNGDMVRLPQSVYEAFRDINAKLKDILSPADYTDVIKEEAAWAASLNEKSEYVERFSQSEMLEKLQQIAEHPEDANLFRRPRFLPMGGEGVNAVHDVFNQSHYFVQGNEKILQTMDSSAHGSVLHFYDARTGRLLGSYTAPEIEGGYNLKGTTLYLVGSEPTFARFVRDCTAETTWAEMGHVELIDPFTQRIQVLEMGIPSHAISQQGLSRYYDASQGSLVRESGFPVKSYFAESYEGEWGKFLARELDAEQRAKLHLDPGTMETWKPFYADLTMGMSGRHNAEDMFVADPTGACVGYKGLFGDVNLVSLKSLRAQQAPADSTTGYEHLKTELKEPLFVNDFMGKANLFERYQAVSAGDGTVFFMLGTDTYSPVRHCSQQDVICGVISAAGEVLVWDRKENRMVPFAALLNKAAKQVSGYLVDSEENEALAPYVLSYFHVWDEYHPLAITETAPGRYRLAYQENDCGKNTCRVAELDLPQRRLKETAALNIRAVAYLPEQKIVVTETEDSMRFSLQQCDAAGNLSPLAELFLDPLRGYAIVLPDGRYTGSPGCEQFLEWRSNGKVTGMKTLAAWRNRPAEVLAALGGNEDDIDVLRQTTERWLKKQGVDSAAKEPALEDLPEIQVTMPELFVNADSCKVGVQVQAGELPISRLLVKMDGAPQEVSVPQLPVEAGAAADFSIELPLVAGQNWFELTPVDAQGRIGNAFRFRVVCTAKDSTPPTLYVVALGVSQYDEEELQLQYAAKDAADIAAAFGSESTQPVRSLLLRDKEVTRSVMEKVGTFLKQAKPQDSVVMFVAGHGMLDAKLNYYYAPCDFDPEQVDSSGIPMEELTHCLQTTPARKRLLLLDTCHSGSMGEEGAEKMALAMGSLPHGVRAVQTRGMKVTKAVPALRGAQQKRYIEEMFSLDDSVEGINILSGSAGAEFARESGEWNNGVFTASVLEAVKGIANADYNADGVLTALELQHYVSNRVRELTNGLQSPSPKMTDIAGFFPLTPSLFSYIQKGGTGTIDETKEDVLLAKLRQMQPVSHERTAGMLLELLGAYNASESIQQQIVRLIKEPCRNYPCDGSERNLLEVILSKSSWGRPLSPLLNLLWEQTDLSHELRKPGAANPFTFTPSIPEAVDFLLHGMHPGELYELVSHGADSGEDSYAPQEQQEVLEMLRRLKEADTTPLNQPYVLNEHLAGPYMAKYLVLNGYYHKLSYGRTLGCPGVPGRKLNTNECAEIVKLFADRVDYYKTPQATHREIEQDLAGDVYAYSVFEDEVQQAAQGGLFCVLVPYSISMKSGGSVTTKRLTSLFGIRRIDGQFKIISVKVVPNGSSIEREIRNILPADNSPIVLSDSGYFDEEEEEEEDMDDASYAGWSAAQLRQEGGRLSDAGQQEQAMQLIRRAADAGDSTAQRWLGWRYIQGRGVGKDKSMAAYWFNRAADQGDSSAVEALRTNGLQRTGAAASSVSSYTPSDPYAGWSAAQLRQEGGRLSDAGQQEQALRLIMRAANAGDSTAQRWLGFRYLNGRGVAKDKNQAKYWFSKAAAQGDSGAAQALKDIR